MSEHDKATVVMMFSACLFVALLALAEVSEGEKQLVIYMMMAAVAGIGGWNGWKALRSYSGE